MVLAHLFQNPAVATEIAPRLTLCAAFTENVSLLPNTQDGWLTFYNFGSKTLNPTLLPSEKTRKAYTFVQALT